MPISILGYIMNIFFYFIQTVTYKLEMSSARVTVRCLFFPQCGSERVL